MPTDFVKPFPGVNLAWDYVPSRPGWSTLLGRYRHRLTRGAAPLWAARVPAVPRDRWIVYFLFLVDGNLTPSHRFSLDQLAREDAGLMVICACPPTHPVLDELSRLCDALYWKGMNGWDFSAYALALSEISLRSSGADVLLMNDSVLGPFTPLTPFIDSAPWRLTGFTGNPQEENHVQSYAFIIKSVENEIVQALKPVLSTEWSYNSAGAAILLQETRLARVANLHMSAGALFFADGSRYQDLCLNCPELLLDAGFPYLKRSLYGKFAGVFQDPKAMTELLERLGHPEIPVLLGD